MRVDNSARSGGLIIFYKMMVCCVYSLESPFCIKLHSVYCACPSWTFITLYVCFSPFGFKGGMLDLIVFSFCSLSFFLPCMSLLEQ